MSEDYLETFLVGGLGLLVVATLLIAWLLWQERQARKMSIRVALAGVGHELVYNLHQVLAEIARLKAGERGSVQDLTPITHPQLDGVIAQPMATDKRALSAVHSVYQSLEACRARVRDAAAHGRGATEAIDQLASETVHAIATAYLWDRHGGRMPRKAGSTRSSAVRRWLKSHGFAQDAVEGMDLHDEVVATLQGAGMALTPRPLSMTAREYYAAPPPKAGRRKKGSAKPAPVEAKPAEADAQPVEPARESPAEAASEPAPEPEPDREPSGEAAQESEEPPYPHSPDPRPVAAPTEPADAGVGDDTAPQPSRRRRARRR